MGLKNSRPLPLATAELEMAPFFKRRFRTWHLDHVSLVVERYHALTSRHCIDSIQLSATLGIKDPALIEQLMAMFMPKTPTRVHHMIDAMEVVISLILVCQAPSMLRRYEAIFDVIDLSHSGDITTADLVVLFGAVARTMMKLFVYTIEPDQRVAMTYINTVLESGIAKTGMISKAALCKQMLSDQYAVHYMKQCTGEDKPKLYFQLEKDTEFLGAIEFHTVDQMKSASLKTIRERALTELFKVPKDFMFLRQGREVKRVWEADYKAWSIVPFAMRGSPGVRTNAIAHNRHTECPRRSNVFEFRHMGNTIARYKKKVSEINPVYKHRSFKISATTSSKPLAEIVRWRVAENWSGEWVYEQRRLSAKSKDQLNKRLRNAPTAKTERVVIKTHRGELISPISEDTANNEPPESRPTTAMDAKALKLYANSPAAVVQKKLDRETKEKKIKWKARVIAMNALQQLDGADPVDDKENEQRRVNRTSSVGEPFAKKPVTKNTTVLIHVHDRITPQPSRLLEVKSTKEQAVKKAQSSKMHVDVIPQKLELRTPSTLSDGTIKLGPFLTVSNIELEEDEVEVFPVIVIRPYGDTTEFPVDAEEDIEAQVGPRQKYKADTSYLTDFEFEISPTESNFEHIYHYTHGTCTDLIGLNRRDVFGRTMLHDAAEYGHSKLLELLLNVRVLRNIGDLRGDTPLHHAAKHGHLKEVSALLREGAAPWQLNVDGKSALFCALETAAKQMKRSAVSHKRPPTRWNDVVSGAASKGVEATKFLVTKDSSSYSKMRQVIDLLWDRYPVEVLNRTDVYDRTSCLELERQVFGDMIEACRQGNLVRVQRLIDLDKRATAQYLNDQLDTLGSTALHEATEQGHSAVVDLLLKFGADGYLPDQRQRLPVHIAAEKGYERIIKCLVFKFPGTLQRQDCTGKTSLHHATERNHAAIALYLIEAIQGLRKSEANVFDMQDMYGYTALHYACVFGNVAVAEALINAGAAPNVSRYEVVVDRAKRSLIGIHWKHSIPGRAATSRLSVNEWRALGPGCDVGFDLDSPAELLLRSCKERPQAHHDRLRILKLLVQACRRESSLQTRSRTKLPIPPLYHFAVDIADTNPSIAVDVCRALHEVKYEINLVHYETTETPLLHECLRVCRQPTRTKTSDSSMDLAVIRTLVQIGANVHLPNEHTGETPLGCAAWYGHLPMVDLLLEAGAQCNSFPRTTFSPLHFAALGDHIACAKLLLASKADVNVHVQSPQQDESPLFFAIRARSVAMVEMLLDRGADPCAICSLKDRHVTSFGVRLMIPYGREIIDDDAVTIASPLTFTLLMARSLHVYRSQAEANGVTRSQKRHAWEALQRIAWLIAKRAIASMTPSGSAGSSLVTRNDVYLASYVGFWELTKLLLTQQVMMSNTSTSTSPNALHLAAAAGQTDVVTALVAAGMNVNCRLEEDRDHVKLPSTSKTHSQTTLVKRRGALYFALTRGHAETAAKLLVLGARPLETLPHVLIQRTLVDREHHTTTTLTHVRFHIHESLPKAVKDKFFAHGERQSTRPSETPTSLEGYHHSRVAANMVYHLECSVNAQIPLLHYIAGMGYTSMAKLLVEAGMNMLAPRVSVENDKLTQTLCKPEWHADTAIHVAILCGQLDVVRYFAGQAQHNFPRFFLREGEQPESLLVTACSTKREDMVKFLISDGSSDEIGGGYNGHDTPEDVELAMNRCAAEHFVEGFALLLRERARPDLLTLVKVLENFNANEKQPVGRVPPTKAGLKSKGLQAATRARMQPHRPLGRAVDLLRSIVPFAKNVESFFKVLSFDHVLKICIICAQYELWFVFEQLFVANISHFMEPLNPWKPLVVRAASCCMVMHRAAMADQVKVLDFFLKIGVPSDLRLPEFPNTHCPIWYAATRGAVGAFVLLALHSPDLSQALDLPRVGAPRSQYRSISSSLSWFAPTSTCRWQNMSAMSCYESPRTRSNVYLIHKYINMWAADTTKTQHHDSLLHVACRTGDPLSVQMLLDAGADEYALNDLQQTPLMVASSRKDAFGVAIVRAVLASATSKIQHRGIDDDENRRAVDAFSRALVVCFSQPAPCNLKTAKLLLAAGADANVDDRSLGSAMRWALQSCQFAAVKLLLDNSAKLSLSLIESFLSQFAVAADNLKTHWRTNASYLKSQGQRLVEIDGILQILLEKKYTAHCLNEDVAYEVLTMIAAIASTTAKHVGQATRFWSICKQWIDQHSTLLSARKTNVWGHKSPLHYAVESLEIGIVRQILDRSIADVDGEDDRKYTPLHLVAINGDSAICEVLLAALRRDCITRIDSVDRLGRTPLHLAVIHGNEAVAAQLVRAGTSLQVRCAQGFNAHLYAASFNQVAILMALYGIDSSRELLYAPNGEFAVFHAARLASFRAVRWFETVFETMEPSTSLFSLKCLDHQRTILHYAARFGDTDLVKHILAQEAVMPRVLDARDAEGYTPLMYAFAFGKLSVVEVLLQAGADPTLAVDHSSDPNTHPYVSRFSIATLGEWFALPGWLSHVIGQSPALDKRAITKERLAEEHYFFASGYHRRRTARMPVVLDRRARLEKKKRQEIVRSSLKSWAFPRTSLFEFACEVGQDNLVELLAHVPIPGTIRRPASYAVFRRAFLEAVQWNRLEIVKTLLEQSTAKALAKCCVTATANDIQFTDFIEVGVDRAVSRGLEDMVILLLSHWKGIKENGREGADDANAFAFQFAQAFQVACIRNLTKVVEYMITRGGEPLVSFHFNDGPALVYAFAFGHTDLVNTLLKHGAHVSAMDTYVAPSFQKWIEFGCPADVQVQWYELVAGNTSSKKIRKFHGPLESYEPPSERLDSESMAALFLPDKTSTTIDSSIDLDSIEATVD